MVVSDARRDEPVHDDAARRVIWHELECGSYTADLALWRELAAAAGGGSHAGAQILDVGSGSGRVALELARAGHAVTALDIDGALLDALARRAPAGTVATVCADARGFALERREFSLCVVPMQTIQLLGGADGRLAFLRRARTHLRPGALLACAIVTALEPFDCTAGGPAPSPESARVDGVAYVSRALRVAVGPRSVLIERERSVHHGARAPERERDVIELDRVSAARLRREGRAAGLTPAPTRTIAATDEHVGSVVVMFRA